MNKLSLTLIGIALFIALLSACNACKYRKLYDNELGANIMLKSANQAYKVQRTKDSTTIYTQQVLVADERTAKIHAESKLKNIQLSVKGKIGVKVKDVVAEYIKPDTIIEYVGENCDSLLDAMAKNTLPIGTQFSTNNKWYYVAGTLDTNNVKLDSIGFNSGKISLVLAGKRGKESVVLTTENPYMNLTNISSVKVITPKQRFNISAGIGYGISTDLKPRPFVGVSLNKTLFRF